MTVCRVDIIIGNIFRYALLFGLTTHVYDSRKHRLVRLPKALYYCASFHIVSVVIVPFVYKYVRNGEYFTFMERHLFERLFVLLLSIQFLAIVLSIVSQWTFRTNAPALFNEIIRMWHKDMASLQWSAAVNRQAGKLFTFRTMSTTLIIVNTIIANFINVRSLLSLLQTFYLLVVPNILIAVMFQFSSGMIFSDYLFRILNQNLTRIVEDIGCLSHIQGPRDVVQRREAKLCRELTAIGRLHTQLRKWVVRFKNMYQLELLVILMTFFVSQIFMMFLVCVVFHQGLIRLALSRFLAASSTAALCGFDLMFNFHICGRLLAACNRTAHILRDLPEHGLCFTRLEKCIEMMCLELKCEKLRLRICGLVDLHGNTGFAMTEAAMLYIILLIQIDYANL